MPHKVSTKRHSAQNIGQYEPLRDVRRDGWRLARAVRRALNRPEAWAWHKRWYAPLGSTHWADGPCLQVAKALNVVAQRRGRMLEVHRGHHAIYELGGVRMDGHGIYNAHLWTLRGPEKPRPMGWNFEHSKGKRGLDWWWKSRAPRVLVRLIREELARDHRIALGF